jgi:hypothetical protein
MKVPLRVDVSPLQAVLPRSELSEEKAVLMYRLRLGPLSEVVSSHMRAYIIALPRLLHPKHLELLQTTCDKMSFMECIERMPLAVLRVYEKAFNLVIFHDFEVWRLREEWFARGETEHQYFLVGRRDGSNHNPERRLLVAWRESDRLISCHYLRSKVSSKTKSQPAAACID